MIRIRLYRSVGIIAILAVAALPCFAGEVAVLKNGFSIRHERRQVIGDVTRLYVNADGSSFVDVRTEDIEHFEGAPEEAAANPTVAPASLSTPNERTGVSSGFPGRPKPNLNDVVNAASGRYR